MSRLTLVGGPNSPFVRKVLIALIEKELIQNVVLERVVPPTTSTKVNPALLARTPLGKIPFLEIEGDRTLYGSDLICEYLDATFPWTLLVPPDGADHWRTLRWNALGTGGLDMLILWRGERLRQPDKQWDDFIATCDAKLNSILSMMEVELPALAQTPFGLGHIAWGCFLGYLDFRFDDLDWRARWPGGVSWYDELCTRHSFAISLPEPQAGSRSSLLEASVSQMRWS